jgi:hypothetical protein
MAEVYLIDQLLAQGLVDVEHAMVLRALKTWLDRLRPRGRSWQAIVAGQPAGVWIVPIIAPNRRTRADQAWWRIVQVRNRFAAAQQLTRLDLVMMVAGDGQQPSSAGEIDELHRGLDQIAGMLCEPRPRPGRGKQTHRFR